jgi:hemin uptake protein HemP
MMSVDPNESRSLAVGKQTDAITELAATEPKPTLASSGPLVLGPTGHAANSIRSINLPKIIPFAELCRCGDEIWIEHERQIYRLRKTKQGKLILTK